MDTKERGATDTRDTLFNTALQACLCPSRKDRTLIPANRPAYLLIPHWSDGKDAAMDVTADNPLQAANIRGLTPPLVRRVALAFLPLPRELLP